MIKNTLEHILLVLILQPPSHQFKIRSSVFNNNITSFEKNSALEVSHFNTFSNN